VSTATHSIDFATADDTAYGVLAAALTDLNIGVLGRFHSFEIGAIANFVQSITLANLMPCQHTWLILQQMR
jgi:hypothetical protein